MAKLEIVVARYNENLDWLKKVSKDFNIIIYNKGLPDIKINLPNMTIIKLPNIGRESHTYLFHIINNYNKLADKTIFCQGDSIFHSPDFLDLINIYIDKFEPVQPLTAFYSEVIDRQLEQPPKPIVDATKNLWIDGKAKIHVEYINNNFIPIYPYYYTDIMIIKLVEKFKLAYKIDNPLKFNVERFRLKNVNLDYLIPMSFVAIFSVDKKVIKDNSVDFYNNIMSILIYDTRRLGIKNNPIDQGLFLERLWLCIFNYQKYNKNYLPLKVTDYKLENYNIKVKNNICNFSYFNIYCNLYISMLLDNYKYLIFISKNVIYLKNFKNNSLFKYEARHDKKIDNILKNNVEYDVLLKLSNNIFTISINDNQIIKFDFNSIKIKHNNLKNVTVHDMGKYNKIQLNIKI